MFSIRYRSSLWVLLALVLAAACTKGNAPTVSFEEQSIQIVVDAIAQHPELKVCNDHVLPIPIKGGYEDVRDLSVTVENVQCITEIAKMEMQPSYGFVDLERYTGEDARDRRIKVHREELVTGTARGDYNPAKQMWAYWEVPRHPL